MRVRPNEKTALIVAALTLLVSCSPASDDDDGANGCECSSAVDNYCDGDNAMRCDGCHFTEQECWCADCASCCTDGECIPSGCDDTPECEGENENYCADDTTLMECQTFPDEWDNYYEEVDCYDPSSCDCGSGCDEEDGVAACWCCQSDAGVESPDAGADGGE